MYVYANYFYNDKQIDVENLHRGTTVTPSQFEEDFKEIHQIVMENYSLYQAKHLNMDSLYQVCDARVLPGADHHRLRTDSAGIHLCLTMRPRHYLLQEVHSQSARSLYRGFLFVDKPSDYLTEYGFQDKDRIIAINGLPYKQWIEQNENIPKHLPSPQTAPYSL